jgi:nitric oxide reductase NorQ protein
MKKIELDKIKPQLKYIDEHNILPNVVYALNGNKPFMLTGDTGSGKSFVVRELCEVAKWDYETINFHSAMTQGEIIGKYDFDQSGKVVWHDGVLTRCMREGKVFIGEEANAMSSAVSLCFYSPMDFKREVVLTKKDGEVVKAHPDFRIVFTGNLGYRGTEKFNPAIQNRIAEWIEVPYLSSDIEAQLLIRETKIEKETAQNMVRVAAAVRANRDKSGFAPLSTRCMINWAEKVKIGGFEPLIAAETTIIPTLAEAPKERDIVRQFVKSVFVKKKFDDDD